MSQVEPNPFIRIAAAARGDLAAQRSFAEEALRRITIDQEMDPVLLIEGLAFARMAASHGEQQDANHLIGLLSLARLFLSNDQIADPMAEALARISLAADHGCDDADQYLNLCAEEATPEIVALSQEYRKLIVESEAA